MHIANTQTLDGLIADIFQTVHKCTYLYMYTYVFIFVCIFTHMYAYLYIYTLTNLCGADRHVLDIFFVLNLFGMRHDLFRPIT